MFVAWDPGPAEPPPGVLDVAVARNDRHTALQVAGARYVWNVANGWRVPVADIPDVAWPLLPMVGGLDLVDGDGTPVGDGAIPATKPEAT